MCNVPVAETINAEAVLAERVQGTLGQLVGAAKRGLLALSVEVGLGVLRELLELEVDELVGPKGKWNLDRSAVRSGPRGWGGDARRPASAGQAFAGVDR